MSQKDYEKIARVINGVLRRKGSLRTIDAVVEDLLPVLKQDNPNFNASRFREACYRDH